MDNRKEKTKRESENLRSQLEKKKFYQNLNKERKTFKPRTSMGRSNQHTTKMDRMLQIYTEKNNLRQDEIVTEIKKLKNKQVSCAEQNCLRTNKGKGGQTSTDTVRTYCKCI